MSISGALVKDKYSFLQIAIYETGSTLLRFHCNGLRQGTQIHRQIIRNYFFKRHCADRQL